MGWYATEARVGLPALDDYQDAQGDTALGTIVTAQHETFGAGEFIYLKGVASTAAGTWVSFSDKDYATVRLVASGVGQVAIAMAATVADKYGWYQIRGKAIGKALTGFADGGLVYATATAGSIDDAVVSGDLVTNALGASALDTPTTGNAYFTLDRPYIV